MTAATDDRSTAIIHGPHEWLEGIEGAVDIMYKGTMLALNAAGYVAPAQDAVGFSRVLGIAKDQDDNSGGSAGDVRPQPMAPVLAKMTCQNATQALVGHWFYVVDDQTLGVLSDTTNAIPGAILYRYISATEGWFYFGGIGQIPVAGRIPLPLTTLREIASNDIQNLAAHGGLLASDSDPALARVNGATDKALRVTWDTAADTDEVQFDPVPIPLDADPSADMTVHLLCAMGGATDTPTIDVQVWDAVGDTEMGGATAAVTGTTVADYSVTISAANIAGGPTDFLNIGLVPGAHTNDALHLYAAWLEYQRL